MSRKGQFYMLDAFFAATILFLGLGLLVSDFVRAPEERPAQVTNQDISSLLFATPMKEIFNTYIQTNYAILNEELTAMQQVHVWQYNASNGCTWCMANATLLVESLTRDIIPTQFGVEIRMENSYGISSHIYNKTTTITPEFMIVNQQVIVSPANTTFFVGPDVGEVRVWQ